MTVVSTEGRAGPPGLVCGLSVEKLGAPEARSVWLQMKRCPKQRDTLTQSNLLSARVHRGPGGAGGLSSLQRSFPGLQPHDFAAVFSSRGRLYWSERYWCCHQDRFQSQCQSLLPAHFLTAVNGAENVTESRQGKCFF